VHLQHRHVGKEVKKRGQGGVSHSFVRGGRTVAWMANNCLESPKLDRVTCSSSFERMMTSGDDLEVAFLLGYVQFDREGLVSVGFALSSLSSSSPPLPLAYWPSPRSGREMLHHPTNRPNRRSPVRGGRSGKLEAPPRADSVVSSPKRRARQKSNDSKLNTTR
jgi:hypothetical protein